MGALPRRAAGRDRAPVRFRRCARRGPERQLTLRRSHVHTEADEALVRRALQVARGALETGDVPVGAVVFGADGIELSAACNAREALGDPTAHAEVLALRAAASVVGHCRLDGPTLAG